MCVIMSKIGKLAVVPTLETSGWANIRYILVDQQRKHTIGPTEEIHLLTNSMLDQHRKSSGWPTEETHCCANGRIPLVDQFNVGPTEKIFWWTN